MRKMLRRLLKGVTAAGLLVAGFSSGSVFADGKTKDVLNVAHRGASAYAPEHTLPSYELGEQMKGDYIEIDLQMTQDGHLIAMHDETLDRTTDGTGRVNDHTLAEIKELDAGSWFNEAHPEYAKPEYVGLKVPTLEEVLDHLGPNKKYYIETKAPEVYPGMEEKLLATLERHGLLTDKALAKRHVLIQSFSRESLLKIHDMNPDIPLVQLLWYDTPAVIEDAELDHIETYAVGVGPNYKMIDREYVQNVRDHGLDLHPYTVNKKADMKKLIDWGVTGMFTNHPDRLHEVLKGR
ncbi:glycerophosphoryl diester phosphodiesterase [Melghirimyces profundicolus]|uniref:Glycerophosphoryl diester phosphodiesterase n=1 Tax=Melghirimyces profundicolus TaxID=1242148 RepID=A0A2T6BGS7_9BACL|nr:glycerophosphodiester phosphodiesterase [Melghirimyces profundicolus]PTX55268.1 glycerophosphoryl diester phosphodiesterase [Melghirimyces profundicolus]